MEICLMAPHVFHSKILTGDLLFFSQNDSSRFAHGLVAVRIVFMQRIFLLLSICGSLFAFGCSSPKQKYDIIVTNRLDQPVTIWLTKDEGPWEEGWVPPEQVAFGNTREWQLGGIELKPNEASEANVTGVHTGPDNP